jgi:hypothetical protein
VWRRGGSWKVPDGAKGACVQLGEIVMGNERDADGVEIGTGGVIQMELDLKMIW